MRAAAAAGGDAVRVWSCAALLVWCAVLVQETAAALDTSSLHRVGALRTLQHRIGGTLYALDDTKLLYTGYGQDGGAPAIIFRYRLTSGTQYLSAAKFIRRAGSDDEWTQLGATEYLDRDVDGVNYKSGEWDVVIPVTDRDDNPVAMREVTAFDVYCDYAGSKMAEFTASQSFASIPTVSSPGPLALQIGQLLGGAPSCAAVDTWSCHQLNPKLNLHWRLNADGLINFRVEGEVAPDTEYMAVGISGSDTTFQMTGGDVVVAYMKNNVPYATDFYLSARSQCGVRGDAWEGACPDTQSGGQNGVRDVSGGVTDGVLSVLYSRLNDTRSDAGHDRRYKYRGRTQIIWATGPLSTTGDIDLPLYHDDRIRDNLDLDLCSVETCEPLVGTQGSGDTVRWEPQCIENQQQLRFEIGPSASSRGYTAITGNPSWGIAYYMNGLLVPYILVQRGVTYNITTATSDQHPLYIATNDRYGGYKSQVIENQRSLGSTRLLAGIDANTGDSTAEGELDGLCEFKETQLESHKTYATFPEFKASLMYSCARSGEATFQWTVPADLEADTKVYYQCAIHQHLGWRIVVTEPSDTNRTTCQTLLDQMRVAQPDNAASSHSDMSLYSNLRLLLVVFIATRLCSAT